MIQTATPSLRVKTPLQERREARDLAIYNEYNALVANPEQSKDELNKYLMEKYDIHSTGTLYLIRQRVAAKMRAERREAKKGGKA